MGLPSSPWLASADIRDDADCPFSSSHSYPGPAAASVLPINPCFNKPVLSLLSSPAVP